MAPAVKTREHPWKSGGVAVRITLSDPSRLRQLSMFLSRDPDAHVRVTADDELELWLLGSRNAWAQVELTEARLRQWMATNTDVIATFFP